MLRWPGSLTSTSILPHCQIPILGLLTVPSYRVFWKTLIPVSFTEKLGYCTQFSGFNITLIRMAKWTLIEGKWELILLVSNNGSISVQLRMFCTKFSEKDTYLVIVLTVTRAEGIFLYPAHWTEFKHLRLRKSFWEDCSYYAVANYSSGHVELLSTRVNICDIRLVWQVDRNAHVGPWSFFCLNFVWC